MNLLLFFPAEAVPATPDSKGHDLTWPYWVGFLIAALLVIVIPVMWGSRQRSDRQPPRL
jgi:hypothetical protein